MMTFAHSIDKPSEVCAPEVCFSHKHRLYNTHQQLETELLHVLKAKCDTGEGDGCIGSEIQQENAVIKNIKVRIMIMLL